MVLELIAYSLSSKIKSRQDVDLWRKRSEAGYRIYLKCYLIGALLWAGLTVFVVIAAPPPSGRSATQIMGAVFTSMTTGLCCGGPIVLLPVWFLFSGGIREYRRMASRLESMNRVCCVCGTIALFGDQEIDASKNSGHTRADLVPHMNVLKEDDKTHVLCDKCLAEVNAVDANETV